MKAFSGQLYASKLEKDRASCFRRDIARVPTLLELTTIPIYIKEQCNNFQGIDRIFIRGTLKLKGKWNN